MTLTPGDRAALDRLLAREWDFAFARRTRLLFEDLDPRPGERQGHLVEGLPEVGAVDQCGLLQLVRQALEEAQQAVYDMV